MILVFITLGGALVMVSASLGDTIGERFHPAHRVRLTVGALLTGAPSTDDKLAQLRELGELKTAGVLTEAEFEQQKAKILAQ